MIGLVQDIAIPDLLEALRIKAFEEDNASCLQLAQPAPGLDISVTNPEIWNAADLLL